MIITRNIKSTLAAMNSEGMDFRVVSELREQNDRSIETLRTDYNGPRNLDSVLSYTWEQK